MSRRDDLADARALLADLGRVADLGGVAGVVAASFLNGYLSGEGPSPMGPVLPHPAPVLHTGGRPAVVIEVADLARLLVAFLEAGGGGGF